jgi:hypothetical protein
MTDWKQITARIRRARTSKDPAAQLSNLFQKTRDAMVAFELAKFFETSGQNADAAKWYSAAAERFRRADWKVKAQEAAVRLGASVGEAAPQVGDLPSEEFALTPPPVTAAEPNLPFERNPEALESAVAVTSEVQQATESSASTPSAAADGQEKRGRRRGRRGGRNRRRGGGRDAVAEAASPQQATEEGSSQKGLPPAVDTESTEPALSRGAHARSMPTLPIEPLAEQGSVRGRYGDPGLSSRISLLEMQFRRLMSCQPAKLDEADRAPAGPGVFVLTDSDLTSYYYVEACQTLRIAIANLSRGGSSRRGSEPIKPRLAEHLGIPETRVAKYLAEHCTVRWLQLDEGASNFAHFVIAVLRPALNE